MEGLPMKIGSATACAAIAAVGMLGLAQNAAAQGKELRYASSSPPNTVWAMQAERFAKATGDASGGKLKISVFLNSQLGSEQDTIQQIARGRIDMGGYSVTAGSLLVPELSLLNLPFLFKSQKQQDCVLDNHLTKLATDSFSKKGVEFLGWTHVGQTNLIGKKPFEKPDDLKGLKARAQPTKIGGYLWTTFGANPNPLPVTEWNSAHQTGLVDVADAPLTFYVFAGLAKVAPVMTRTSHLDQGGVTVINKAVYDALSADEKKALDAGRSASPAAQLRAEVRGFEKRVEEKFKAEGGTTVELDDAKREVWRKGMEASWPKAVEAIGGESSNYWKAIVDGLKACGA
jgi:TRAP-type C4-dicarboxylate transport system substrate-binding protein